MASATTTKTGRILTFSIPMFWFSVYLLLTGLLLVVTCGLLVAFDWTVLEIVLSFSVWIHSGLAKNEFITGYLFNKAKMFGNMLNTSSFPFTLVTCSSNLWVWWTLLPGSMLHFFVFYMNLASLLMRAPSFCSFFLYYNIWISLNTVGTVSFVKQQRKVYFFRKFPLDNDRPYERWIFRNVLRICNFGS